MVGVLFAKRVAKVMSKAVIRIESFNPYDLVPY